MNDVQAEITAVEDALLGTITHSVNITGASTLATVQAGASTFSVRPLMPPPDVVKVFLASTVTIGSSGASTLEWTGQAILTNSSLHSTTTNPARLTPQTTGIYRCLLQCNLSDHTDGARVFNIVDSSADNVGNVRFNTTSASPVIYQAGGLKRFDALGGYLRAIVSRTGTSTLSISSGVGESWFAMEKL